MNPRNRRIKARVERDRRWKEQSARFDHNMKCIVQAVSSAIARGETKLTARTRREMNSGLLIVASQSVHP